MIDPLIGLSFDPARVHFATWQDSATTSAQLGIERKWIFACASLNNGSVCVIAGHHWVKPDGVGMALLEPDFGAVVYRHDNKYEILGVPDRMFDEFDENPIVSANTRDQLMQDAVMRYIQAFGGAAKFQAELEAQAVKADSLPVPLLDALKNHEIVITTSENRVNESKR
ncbi:MAG: hypothetical protein JSR71_13980 [Proteobacteria bacterium]|nr:hypothetical protein [Pseudomonadota bacterium]